MAKVGIVIQNLGSPKSTSVADVRAYLKEFLMDEQVIDLPYAFRWLLVKGIIAPTRASKSAHAYSQVWTDFGSPLVTNTMQFATALEAELGIPVLATMRYGELNPKNSLGAWINNNAIEEMVFLPMYPQYATSTSLSSTSDFLSVVKSVCPQVPVRAIPHFFKEKFFTDSLASTVRAHLDTHPNDYILFSYHGVPLRHLRRAVGKDNCIASGCTASPNCCEKLNRVNELCYRAACFETTRQVVAKLGLPTNRYSTSFQSRLGSGWTQPFTDKVIPQLADEGVKSMAVVTPSFTADCLETLEEIGIRAKEDFLAAGGASFSLIPCLNAQSHWVTAIGQWLKSYAYNEFVGQINRQTNGVDDNVR